MNCYLVKGDAGFVLIDTGISNKRNRLDKELESAGCKPGNLKLIVLTHGDFDHTGNAAYLRTKFGAKVAMHQYDSGMLEKGDTFWNRKRPNIIVRLLAGVFLRFGKSKRIKPDLFVEDGQDLSGYGLDAVVIHIPGHSKGSLGLLTTGGDLFCGDVFSNRHKPAFGNPMDDVKEANASIEKLINLKINTVYPGHGKPFPMEQFMKSH